jgi:hypothetical protein
LFKFYLRNSNYLSPRGLRLPAHCSALSGQNFAKNSCLPSGAFVWGAIKSVGPRASTNPTGTP